IHGKDGAAGGSSQFGNVRGIGIENGPADSGSNGSTSELRERGAADRFENNSGRAKSCIGLNGAQKLRALRDGVAIGVNDFEFGAKILGGDTRGCGLLELKIVGLRDK